uniref:hydroxymethylglutaryl-CoA lyase n=1 Tax=Glossina pallidipes TaxID=7398 RepID=A0A1A9ZZG5_GLOPL
MHIGAKKVPIFGAAFDAFSFKNVNCTVAESIECFRPVLEIAHKDDTKVRGYVSAVVACPYEGPIKEVRKVMEAFYDMGCYEFSLGDTMGVRTPGTISKMFDEVTRVVPPKNSLFTFMIMIDSFVSGLGGCLYARDALCNATTEDCAKSYYLPFTWILTLYD